MAHKGKVKRARYVVLLGILGRGSGPQWVVVVMDRKTAKPVNVEREPFLACLRVYCLLVAVSWPESAYLSRIRAVPASAQWQ